MEARSDPVARIAATDPLPDGARFDRAISDELRAKIAAQPRFPARSRPSRRLVAAIVLAAVVLTALPALAFSDGVRSVLGFQPEPVFEKSRLLVSAPVERGAVAHLWSTPSTTGGDCTFVTYGLPGKIERPTRMTGGGSCALTPGSSEPLMVSISKYRDDPVQSAGPVIHGYLDSSLGATRVEIRWTGGSKELAYANDHFLGLVEALRQSTPKKTRPIRILAYDANGRVVHKIDINPAWFRIN